MATKVLDSWALIAFFEDEPAAGDVEKLLQQAADEKHKLLMSVVNWGEVYYSTMRAVSQEAAEQKADEIAALPIEIIGVSDDLALARQAAIFKASHKMSYADCFAAAWPSRSTLNSSPATRSSRPWRRKSKSCGLNERFCALSARKQWPKRIRLFSRTNNSVEWRLLK